LVYRFTGRCQCETDICKCGSLSGDVYWAKNGMAGASMKWCIPVYASTIFYNRTIPQRWPSGVLSDNKNGSTKSWKYEDNLTEKEQEWNVILPKETACLSIF
jgi:hypothetical protein